MTDHDRQQAIGALSERHFNAKRTRAALVGQLGEIRSTLDAFARNLQTTMATQNLFADTVPVMPNDYPDPKVISGMLSDLKATCHEITHTQRLLKDAGVDVS